MRLGVVVAVSCAVAGCQHFDPYSDAADDLNGRGISLSGAGVVLSQPFKPYTAGNLATLIYSSLGPQPVPTDGSCGIADNGDDAASQCHLQQSISWFGNQLYTPAAFGRQNELRDARNQIQGMILTTSANRCNAYKLALREKSTNISFALGSIATVLGAAGAIFSNATSQIFSGMSASASGVNAEYNKDIMSNVTSSVIIPGIDKQRSAILQEISNRRCLGVSSYPLSFALADAVRYHSACSTDVGVAAASSALSQSSTTSLSDAKATIDAIRAMHDALTSKASDQPKSSAATPSAKPSSEQKDKKPENPSPGTADNSEIKITTTLLGNPIDLLQCPSLTSEGLLPRSAVPSQSSTLGSSGQIPYGLR